MFSAVMHKREQKRLDDYSTRLLRALATANPEETDQCIAAALRGAKDHQGDAASKLFKMLAKCFAGTRHQPLEYVWVWLGKGTTPALHVPICRVGCI